MVWAFIVIPIVVGLSLALFLGYTVERAKIGQKATWRNLLTITSFFLLVLPIIFMPFFLPEPLRDYALLGIFSVLSLILWIRILTDPLRKKRAGSLLWNLGRSSSNRVMMIGGMLFFFSAMLQTSLFINSANKGFSGNSSSPEYFLSQIILYWSVAFYFFWAGSSRLQLRENGIYFKLGLIEWSQIASYQWEGVEGNTLTVWLKQRFPFFPTRSWSIPLVHKATIERIIMQHLSSRTGKTKNYT